jgi:hypothetical protein
VEASPSRDGDAAEDREGPEAPAGDNVTVTDPIPVTAGPGSAACSHAANSNAAAIPVKKCFIVILSSPVRGRPRPYSFVTSNITSSE